MGFSGRGAGACALIALAACSPFGGGAFHCDTDAQCAGGAGDGRCELNGFCSFPDPHCPSQRSYGSLSGALANVCVGDEPAIDAPLTDTRPIDTAPPPPPFCNAAGDPTLVGCWELEGTVNDASGDGNNGTAVNASYGAGKVGMGLVLQATTVVTVPDTASLAPPAITLEAWIRPTALPTGGARMGIIDNNNSYGLFLYAGEVRCTVSIPVNAIVSIPVDQWTHIACTYDGSSGRLYVNGALLTSATGGAPLTTGDASGTVLGGNSPGGGDTLIGTIDQVRVFNVARTAMQICEAAGLATCP